MCLLYPYISELVGVEWQEETRTAVQKATPIGESVQARDSRTVHLPSIMSFQGSR